VATFSDRLKKLRKEKGITLDKMAEDLGTTKSTLSRYENGKREPKIFLIKEIANYFNVSIDYLLGRADKRQLDDEKIEIIRQTIDDDPDLLEFWNNISARDDLVMLFKQTKNLSPDAIKSIIQFIKAIENEEKIKGGGIYE
jgi:transcriptional regulator with XRE-family HTH domain